MKKFNLKDILVPTIALFLIAAVATALLALTNNVTKSKIAEVAAKTAEEARQKVCTDAASFEEIKYDGASVFAAKDADGNVIGYAITTTDKSYGGAIEVMTGISADGKITGVEILSIDDTPGLGMNAKKDGFRDQYKGKSGTLTVSKNATADNEISAITGATITSNAVTRCVNSATEVYKAVTGGEQNG